ncbi:MAG: tRNA lysidine(34) synthetase TilS [Shimia sp.]
MSLPERFAATMGRLVGPNFPPAIGLAVSGGGDSMAMLHLAAGWARPMGIALRVATVDHGLRDAAAAEAALVGAECAVLGLPHDVLDWRWDGRGNLQAAAREGRMAALGAWADGPVLFAHTRDDQAETVLLRLARGSGVEGLAGILERRELGGWEILRPLLDVARDELRHYSDTLRIPYVDDPSNDDPRFDRVKARRALAALAPLGVDAEGLAATAGRMARARAALEARARVAAAATLAAEGYELAFDRDAFATIERDTQMRLMAAALCAVSGATYRPRAAALEEALDRALGGGATVLHGGHVLPRGGRLWVLREARALDAVEVPTGEAFWDGRIACTGADVQGLWVRALGTDGLAQARAMGIDPPPLPARALHVTPALFDGARVVACRRLTLGPPYAETFRDPRPFAQKAFGGPFAR